MRLCSAVLLGIAVSICAATGYDVERLDYSNHGSVNSNLDDPLRLRVTDPLTGSAVEGLMVTFKMLDNNGSLLPIPGFIYAPMSESDEPGHITELAVYTNADGIAAVDLELGSRMGEINVDAVVLLPDANTVEVEYAVVAIDLKNIIFQIVGGLAVFLFGMRLMSQGLQNVAGNRMRSILEKLTSNRFMGVIAGALVTAAIQSSSATTVITVSFVNSALMTLQQAVGVVLGANIGTTITGQLIAFRITSYAYPMIAVGFILVAFSKRRKRQLWGQVIIGLGLLFLGMNAMSGILQPLRTSAPVRDFFMTFSDSPILAILAGTIVTVLVQSSSATVGLTMTLAGAGLISLQGAVYIVLGDNIGTTITAQLAAIGSNRAARRTAMAHTLFNVIGAFYFALLLYNQNGFFLRLVRSLTGDPMRQVANAHSIFNIFNCLMFIPLVPLLTRLCTLLIPGSDSEKEDSVAIQLDERLLESPVLAIDAIEREVVKMARYAGKTVKLASACFLQSTQTGDRVMLMEDNVDIMQRDITVYASKLFQQNLSSELSLKLPVLLHTINDLERVSDHAVNMVEASERIQNKVLEPDGPLSLAATQASEMVAKMIDAIVIALEKSDRQSAERALMLEGELNQLEVQARSSYGESLTRFGLSDMNGLALLDFIDYCERIGDHLTNVAQSLLGGGVWQGQDDIH